jgi:outer membrane lipoprotein-sorting protein
LKKTIPWTIATLLLLFPALADSEGFEPPALAEVLLRLRAVYSKHCCFKATFDQITVNTAMDLRDHFQGTMYVKKPGMIALEVNFPERQQVILRGRSYIVYFPDDGNSVKGDVPPDVNLDHFFGFFADIDIIRRGFTVSFPAESSYSEKDKLIRLQLVDRKKTRSGYRILLGIDADRYTIKRAIIYDALGNYNRFDLSDIVFLDSLPDSRFRIRYDRSKGVDESEFLFPSKTKQ